MSRVVLHCLHPQERKALINHATSEKLTTSFPHADNPHSLEISGEAKQLENFVNLYENNPNVTIFYDHSHPKSGKDLRKPHLRKSLKHHIDTKSTESLIPKTTNYGNTANFFKTYYNYPTQNGTAPVIAVISLGGNYKPTDLVYYWHTILGIAKWATVLNVSVDNAHYAFTGSDSDIENTLDTEIIGAMCPGATILFYSAPNTNLGFYDAINAAISGSTINGTLYKPSIISISWGAPESEYSTSMMNSYDQLFSLGNSRNITTCIAAGDNGSTDGLSGNTPHLDFPSSSPHAVACGGTSIASAPETTWSWNASEQWGTGGGISANFAEPVYQVGIVTYPTGTTPSISNLIGKRASPDIALNADPESGWTIYFNGQALINGIGGTSCVAPAMSGLLGLINLNYPSGFNTYLYNVYRNNTQKALCFKDITTGTNDSIRNSTHVYSAGVGYDCCTGLGSLNGVNLYNALKTGL